ncbi:MAG TPA: glycosyltransferase family 4 protein [Candidatus Paceibacterota bacterium]|nr:glycosyltransferase family 4 protein [Candidatus Paceibacterota bacterium]
MSNHRPRALIFSTAYFPHVGGAEVAIKEITDRLPSWEFDLVTARLERRLPLRERVGNVTVYRVGFGSPLDKALLPILGTLKVFGLLLRNRYGLFWAMMVTFASGIPYIVNILRRLLFFRPLPVVLTLQEGDSEEHIAHKEFGLAGRLWRILMMPFIAGLPKQMRSLGLIGVSWSLALRRTACVTAISTYLSEQARRYGYAGPIETIPNGVAVELFSSPPDVDALSELRSKLAISLDDKVLVTTSRLVLKNGIDAVIRALPLLPPDVKFVIVGTGELEAKLHQLAEELKVTDRVRFVGAVGHAAIPQYLALANIFVRLSRSEGMGNSFIEAMAARVPVIGTPVGGIPDFLHDHATGWVCPVDDSESLARTVREILDPVNMVSVGQVINQAEALARGYDWESIAQKMEKVFLRASSNQVHGKQE